MSASIKYVSTILAVLLPALSHQAAACDCHFPETAEAEYAESSMVFLGKIVAVSHPFSFFGLFGNTEKVTFLVTKSWKGVEAGTTLVFKSEIFRGLCGRSVNNRQDRELEERVIAKYNPGAPTKISDTWLVYTGEQSYSLSKCSRSNPENVPYAPADIEALNKLVPTRD